MAEKIGIIGFGNMGSAIAERIKSEYTVFVFDKDKGKTRNLKRITVTDTLFDLVRQADAVLLAVKPQDLDSVLKEIRGFTQGKLIISIAAGVSTKHIEKLLGKVRVIRAMPNLPAKIGKGMISLSRGNSAKTDDLSFSERLFKKLGNTMILEERMIDAVTAVSGSGPGFFYKLLESENIKFIKVPISVKRNFAFKLTEAAKEVGFSEQQARLLANSTTAGSISLLEVTGSQPQELCNQVASKGGTTEAGLRVLDNGGSLIEAVKAAKKRAKELSKK